MSLIRFAILFVLICGCNQTSKQTDKNKEFYERVRKNYLIERGHDGKVFARVLSGYYIKNKKYVCKYPADVLTIVQRNLKNKIQRYPLLEELHKFLDLRLENTIDSEIQLIFQDNLTKKHLAESPRLFNDIFHLFALKSKIMAYKNKSIFDYLLFIKKLDSKFATIVGISLVSQIYYSDKIKPHEIDALFLYFEKEYLRLDDDEIKLVVISQRQILMPNTADEAFLQDAFLKKNYLKYDFFDYKAKSKDDYYFDNINYFLLALTALQKYIIVEGKWKFIESSKLFQE